MSKKSCSCGCLMPVPMASPSSGRRRHLYSPSLAHAFAGLILAAVVHTSSGYVSPRRHPSASALPSFRGPTSARESVLPAVPSNRIRGKIRVGRTMSTSLFVSLESPSSATATSELDELMEDAELASNATVELISMDVAAELLPPRDVSAPILETDKQHMERVRMGDDVEELTHLLAHDEVDLQGLLFPSVPVSYDESGMVQADASAFAPALSASNELPVVMTNGAAVVVDSEQDYPAFIKFLFQKDANGQTLASKVFNLALLAASFGYVFVSVFNIDKGMTRGWTPAEIGMRIPLDTWASYENSLSEKPVATKTIINIVIYLLGDWLSQTLFTGKNVLDFDAVRTLKNGFVGMCFGPAVHEYYEFSDWILPVDGVTFGLTNRAFKIFMDQTAYLSVKCSIYILAIGVLNGESVEAGAENVKNRIKPIMFTAWKFWPLVHCVTYGLIPARHRILWVNSVDLVWNAILASKARADDDGDSEGGKDDGKDTNLIDVGGDDVKDETALDPPSQGNKMQSAKE